MICDGSAVLRDNTLHMTLHYTHTHTVSQERDAYTLRIDIDIRILTGTLLSLGVSWCN